MLVVIAVASPLLLGAARSASSPEQTDSEKDGLDQWAQSAHAYEARFPLI